MLLRICFLGLDNMSKRKPHNRIKRLITQSKLAVRDLALVMTFSDELVDLVKYKTGKPITISL
jgi:hypothetical protein